MMMSDGPGVNTNLSRFLGRDAGCDALTVLAGLALGGKSFSGTGGGRAAAASFFCCSAHLATRSCMVDLRSDLGILLTRISTRDRRLCA